MLKQIQKPIRNSYRVQALAELHRATLIFLIFLTVFSSSPLISSQPALAEYEAKGLLLYNFAKFTTWPKSAFDSPHAPLIIGVLGPNPFGETLSQFHNKTVKGRPIEIRYFPSATTYTKSHVLFCNVPNPRALQRIQAQLRLAEKHVLTVGDFNGFAASGGIIGLTFEGNRIALELNGEASRQATLFLSPNLVRLAKAVK